MPRNRRANGVGPANRRADRRAAEARSRTPSLALYKCIATLAHTSPPITHSHSRRDRLHHFRLAVELDVLRLAYDRRLLRRHRPEQEEEDAADERENRGDDEEQDPQDKRRVGQPLVDRDARGRRARHQEEEEEGREAEEEADDEDDGADDEAARDGKEAREEGDGGDDHDDD